MRDPVLRNLFLKLDHTFAMTDLSITISVVALPLAQTHNEHEL
ncbi:unnamed protein product [Acidithrix sp. C25]|nr:unnamed protein product [Acidithrix sp. C25]